VDLTALRASELSEVIHDREVSCIEVMTAYLDRIDERNPSLNAIVSLRDREVLIAEASGRDDELAQGRSRGWMHGFPHAAKDLAETAGLRTTMGSPLLADHVPAVDALHVARIRAVGAIIIAKTNVPEFGLGSNTFNPVFGATVNPFDPSRVAGGSSGGATVALATCMVPVADGSDYMGSLRNPAGWCNVIGFRPSQGRVPAFPVRDAYTGQCATDGPMGRTVLDVALLLGTQAGWDRRAPLSVAGRLTEFDSIESARRSLDGDLTGVRIGWLADLDGHLAMEPGILEVCEEALARMTDAGAEIVPVSLPFDHDRLWEAWLLWRHAACLPTLSPWLRNERTAAQLKPEARWEAERGMAMSAMDLKRAAITRSAFHEAITGLIRTDRTGDGVDVLALPTAQVWPFSIEDRWPQRIGDREMDTYHRWMECTIHATFAGLPAISMPAGFGDAGLPAGIQLIGGPLDDVGVLRIAAAYEQTIGHLAVGNA